MRGMFKRRKISSRKASSSSKSYAGRSRKFGGRSAGRFRRFKRNGGVLSLLRKFKARSRGVGRQGPADRYILTHETTAATVDPDLSDTIVADLWGGGVMVGALLSAVRGEAISTLLGGAFLYQPTLKVYGFSTLDVVAAGNSDIIIEFIQATAVANAVVTTATLAANFSSTWAQSFDARPTGFESFPDTSMLENYRFWDRGTNNTIKPVKRWVARIKVGKPRRFIFKFKTRVYRYEDYSQGTMISTGGMMQGKTNYIFMKVKSERGQVCGVKSAVNQPILTEIGAPYMIKIREHYFYRWVAGNNRPTIYGLNLAATESVNEDALSWIGVNALKAQRFNQAFDVSAGYPSWGGQDSQTHHEANINFTTNCAGEVAVPQVAVGP